jgi:hypothetical protein
MKVRLTSSGRAADCENFYERKGVFWRGEWLKCSYVYGFLTRTMPIFSSLSG